MLEQYLNRMTLSGSSMSEALNNNATQAVNQAFTRDPSYKVVYVTNDIFTEDKDPIDAKFFVHSYLSITGDQVDYYLQFRPGVYYDIGSYVSIPNRDGKYEWWLIVNQDNQPQFPLYYILKCNWTMVWMSDNKMFSCLGVQRSRSSYNSGTWTADTFTVPENQTQIWLPTNNYTRTICYNTTTIISNNPIHPVYWDVTKVEDSLPFGISKIVLYQKQAPSFDTKLAIETFRLNGIEMINNGSNQLGISIIYKGKPTIKMAGNFKTFNAQRADGSVMVATDQSISWNVEFPIGYEPYFETQLTQDGFKIKCNSYYDSTNANLIVLRASDSSGQNGDSIVLEVIG